MKRNDDIDEGAAIDVGRAMAAEAASQLSEIAAEANRKGGSVAERAFWNELHAFTSPEK